MTALFKVEAGMGSELSLDYRYLGTQGTSHALLKQHKCTSCDEGSSQPERVRSDDVTNGVQESTSFGGYR